MLATKPNAFAKVWAGNGLDRVDLWWCQKEGKHRCSKSAYVTAERRLKGGIGGGIKPVFACVRGMGIRKGMRVLP